MLPAGPATSAARVVWDVSEQGQALLAVLFPHLAGLRVLNPVPVLLLALILGVAELLFAVVPKIPPQSEEHLCSTALRGARL